MLLVGLAGMQLCLQAEQANVVLVPNAEDVLREHKVCVEVVVGRILNNQLWDDDFWHRATLTPEDEAYRKQGAAFLYAKSETVEGVSYIYGNGKAYYIHGYASALRCYYCDHRDWSLVEWRGDATEIGFQYAVVECAMRLLKAVERAEGHAVGPDAVAQLLEIFDVESWLREIGEWEKSQ